MVNQTIRRRSGMLSLSGALVTLGVLGTLSLLAPLITAGARPVPRAPKQRTTTLKLKFNQAGRLDTDPTMLDVAETSNVVLSPDGSEAMPRPGYVVNRHYNALPPVGQEGRKVIMIDRFPGNGVALTQHMIINSATGSIDALHYTKEPTIAAGESTASVITLTEQSVNLGTINWGFDGQMYFDPHPLAIRGGNLSVESIATPVVVYDPTGFNASGIDQERISPPQVGFPTDVTEFTDGEIHINFDAIGGDPAFPEGTHVEVGFEYRCNDGVSEMFGNAVYTIYFTIGHGPP